MASANMKAVVEGAKRAATASEEVQTKELLRFLKTAYPTLISQKQ